MTLVSTLGCPPRFVFCFLYVLCPQNCLQLPCTPAKKDVKVVKVSPPRTRTKRCHSADWLHTSPSGTSVYRRIIRTVMD